MKKLITRFCWVLPLLVLLAYSEHGVCFPQQSLYNVSMPWQDDRGKSVMLSDFVGRDVVITMAYTSCSATCPLTISRLKKLDNQLKQHQKQAEIVIVTYDPKQDTPKHLSDYRKSQNLTEAHWHFLTGQVEDVRKLSHLLGMSYQQNPNSQEITHSNKIVLLDKNGVTRLFVEGLAAELTPITLAIVNDTAP